ncbi:MAG: alpha/beta hydrolase fold domain-containing protein [Acidobacteria bacterium]|nr:alpha/beta hydrolase fold domain-containing protein [Acidobacteriota bacterium]
MRAARVCGLLLAVLALQAASPGRKYTTLERLDAARLEAVHQARARFAAARKPVQLESLYNDYRAVLHVHAEDSKHTFGTRDEVLRAAKATGVSVVFFTDHNGPRPETWSGLRDGVLFIPGAEGDGFLKFPAGDRTLTFLSHPEERYDADVAALHGMEIYNRHTDAKDETGFYAYFEKLRKDPAEWKKLAAKVARYPDECFAAQADYWPEIFAKWDRDAQQQPLTGIAANDAHHNQVYDGVDFDPYPVSFRNVSTHILAQSLSEDDIRRSLREGHAYVSHDWLADPTGFSFIAGNNLGIFDMGDPVYLAGTTRLVAQTPIEAKLKLIHDGKIVEEKTASRLEYVVKEPGVYRLEAWLNVDEEERPWIYSNPIYAKAPDPASLSLPSRELAPAVEAHKDIAYLPDEEAKHKLDIYVPKGKQGFPVLFFIHGGAWRTGDRVQYAALGNRFAREGIGVVAISYRLAPAHQHPAQIQDAAAALAWVFKNIGQYGGRADRIFVGGHSAGGHLAALLALDERYLKAHGRSPREIRGVIPMSGVYDIHGLDSVFGSDPDVKREASPLTYVKAPAPPFVITYAQWDYLTLPLQARRLYAALRAAGVAADLVFVPREGHISEMLHIVQDDDVTANAVVRFVQSRAGD